jgi:hypothetical protein
MTPNKQTIATYVTNVFTNSQYIKNRKYPTGEIKYFPEEIEFWAEQIFSSNWDYSVFDAEFVKTYSVNHDKSLSTKQPNDYIGQTFLIDTNTYPNGMFISSISIFLEKSAKNIPITLEVKPLINGIPSDGIPLSKVTISSPFDSITYSWDSTLSAENQSGKLNFKFDFPVYLSAGYYCFTLKTNSSDHIVYIAENGKGNIDSGNIVVNPYLGDFIYSGQGESWVIDPTKDLCFILNQAIFDIGDKNLHLNVENIEKQLFDYDTINLTSSIKQFGTISYIKNSEVSVKDFYTEVDTVIPIIPNSNVNVPSHSKLTASNGIPFTLTLTNTDKNLTPIIDLERTGVALIKNYIDQYSIELSDSELTPLNGLASAKYTSKPVILNEDFDADGITVYVDVNKPEGTRIEVFYRILNRNDYSIAFNESKWYRLPKKSTAVPALAVTDYVEECYEDLNVTYAGVNGETYDSFNQIAVKVIFYSDESSKVPSIKNLRVIVTV